MHRYFADPPLLPQKWKTTTINSNNKKPIYMYIYVCMHTYMHMHMHMCIPMYTNRHTYIPLYTHICMYTHIYIKPYIKGARCQSHASHRPLPPEHGCVPFSRSAPGQDGPPPRLQDPPVPRPGGSAGWRWAPGNGGPGPAPPAGAHGPRTSGPPSELSGDGREASSQCAPSSGSSGAAGQPTCIYFL